VQVSDTRPRGRYVRNVAKRKQKDGLFSAVLKYWRGLRGMSQLDLALAADVSARHISFLETGRAQPSREMVLTLGSTLDVPMREQNTMLRAAGCEDVYAEPGLDGKLAAPISHALELMLSQQEPFPMVVMNRRYDVVRTNHSAQKMLSQIIAEPEALVPPLNAFKVLFDPRLARPFIVDWERVGRAMLSRLHREALHRREDNSLSELVDEILALPDVPAAWRQPDFSADSQAAFSVRMKRDDLELAFLTTLTKFSAPQNITLEELQIESYFPLDEATEKACRSF
jgi:transcriptional regulator with XRE-family HTH domain